MSSNVGARRGPYDVTALIGEGGKWQVYRATDSTLNRTVALKIMPETFRADPDRLARFQRKAEVLASLNHANIAQIYGLEQARPLPRRTEDGASRDKALASVRAGGGTPAPVQETDGLTVLVMELVEDPTLADRISQRAVPLDEALPIAKQIAEALEAAHEAGVIQRDLKPGNIKAREDGIIKVLDFGLAKAFAEELPERELSQSPTLSRVATRAGVFLGTATYMGTGPDNVVDKRSDIFSCGIVVYELSTGKKEVAGEGVSEILAVVIRAEPDWKGAPSELDSRIHQLLHQRLREDRKNRRRPIGDAPFAASISTDRDRFLRCACRSCSREFTTQINSSEIQRALAAQCRRMDLDVGDEGPDERSRERIRCPYCGHEGLAGEMQVTRPPKDLHRPGSTPPRIPLGTQTRLLRQLLKTNR